MRTFHQPTPDEFLAGIFVIMNGGAPRVNGRQALICLYRGDADTTWCRGKGWTWHAADAIDAIADDEQARADWHRLIALYPGW